MSAPGSSRSASAQELGKLLRARRASLTPAELGLPEGRRRRTPGLRREEVSQLAAISPTYYALLEQGRGAHPSPQVLDALATALRLNPAERVYLDALANGQDSPRPVAGPQEALIPGVAALVERLDPHPTYVTGRRWDILAASPEARTWWKRHDIAPLGSGTKRLRHPQLGELLLQHVVLQVADNPEHKLVTFTPSPDDEKRINTLIARTAPPQPDHQAHTTPPD
ncbi:MAG TPA: helix-turn-helix transcriptional regulator [Solirubrobacteraceae bacterium]|jgi:transcriptional regulator with XRE-family HTH domain